MASSLGLAEIRPGEDKLCWSPLLGKKAENIVKEDNTYTLRDVSRYEHNKVATALIKV